jgi:hypothetical protein
MPCIRNDSTPTEKVVLLDGRDLDAPLMEWGTGRCWPHGSDSNISRDYIVRGLYYAHLVNFLKFIKSVSACGTCSLFHEHAVGSCWCEASTVRKTFLFWKTVNCEIIQAQQWSVCGGLSTCQSFPLPMSQTRRCMKSKAFLGGLELLSRWTFNSPPFFPDLQRHTQLSNLLRAGRLIPSTQQ